MHYDYVRFLFSAILATMMSFTTAIGQVKSTMENTGLMILDEGISPRSADYLISGVTIQDGFNFSQVTDSLVSAGSDLIRSTIDETGFSIREFAMARYSTSTVGLRTLAFTNHDETSPNGNFINTWTFGMTDLEEYNSFDPVSAGLYLDHFYQSAEQGGITITYARPVFIHPGDYTISVNGGNVDYGSQLYVKSFSNNPIAVWGVSESTTEANTGVYGLASGIVAGGSGQKVGVWGIANNSSDIKYGVVGEAYNGQGANYAVYASGDLVWTGSHFQVSDRKLKKDIGVFDGLETILQLRPRTYTFRRDEFTDMHLSEGKQYGFIAQELQEVLPDMVREQRHPISRIVEGEQDQKELSYESIDYLGVRTLDLIPIMTRAIQEQQDIIDVQNRRMTEIELENDELRTRLQQLEAQMREIKGQEPDSNPVILSSARLDQNFPNPYDEQTAIRFFIPESVAKAELQIISAEGRLMRTIAIDARGEGKQVLQARALQAGSYFYALVLDGQPMATRQMLLLK